MRSEVQQTRSGSRTTTPRRAARSPRPAAEELIPPGIKQTELVFQDRKVRLTNLEKVFWPDEGYTKGDLLRYYLEIAPWLLPHLQDRAMVMKRYPNGIAGKFFFQKRAPEPRPDWVEICTIAHAAAGDVNFAVVRDLPTLLWVVNLGSIELNPWYARCADPHRPDYLHFDLDPVAGADFAKVCQAALLVHEALDALRMPHFAKTAGSRGLHVYVPIVFGPTQKEVWGIAKELAQGLARLHPDTVTAEYRIARRPKGRVLVDYNQNAWGRTLAAVYSARPKPGAPVSTPVSWDEIKQGLRLEDFTIRTVPARVKETGDVWQPLLQNRGRFDLKKLP